MDDAGGVPGVLDVNSEALAALAERVGRMSVTRRVRRLLLLAEGARRRWRIRHGRKSALQRDWESGDPVRVARVKAVAARVRAEIEAEDAAILAAQMREE